LIIYIDNIVVVFNRIK